MIGAADEAEAAARMAIHEARGAMAADFAKVPLGRALARLGRLEEARAVEARRSHRSASNDLMYGAITHAALAEILLASGDHAKAEGHSRAGAAMAVALPPMRAFCLAYLARALFARGKIEEARAAAVEGLEIMNHLGIKAEGDLPEQ